IRYNYILRNADGSMFGDWPLDRSINPASLEAAEVVLIDSWNHPGFPQNAFYTEPFKQVLLRNRFTQVRIPSPGKLTHIFKVKAPLLEKGQTLCLLGSATALGQWDPARSVLLNRVPESDSLTAELELGPRSVPLAYKYGLFDLEKK